MPLVAAYISRYYATRMPSETNISLRCWWVRSSGVIEVLADRTTERHENMNSRNTSTSTTAVRARACDSILLYIHAHETCSQRSIGWSDLAALESCRFVSHGCGVPALPTIQPWRLKSYDAAQLQLRTVKLLRCADYHFNFLGIDKKAPWQATQQTVLQRALPMELLPNLCTRTSASSALLHHC